MGKSSLFALLLFSTIVLGYNSLASIYSSSGILLHIPCTILKTYGGNAVVFFSPSQASQNHSTEMNNSMDICIYLKGQRSHQESQKILHKYNKIQTTV